MTTVHCAVAKDYKTGEVFKFGPDQIEDFVRSLDGQVVIGHNIINFDLPALDLWASLTELTDISLLLPNPHMVIDTLVLSRLLNPDRVRPKGLPQRVGPHSLEAWGHRLGIYKGDYGKQEDAWGEYNEEMMEYCKQDVFVTEQVYKHLLKEMDN
jgi:DNA polymerase III epsilon subunit-like protein